MALEIPTLVQQPLDKSRIQDLALQQATLDSDWDRQDLVVKILLALTLDQQTTQAYSVRYYHYSFYHDLLLILYMIGQQRPQTGAGSGLSTFNGR